MSNVAFQSVEAANLRTFSPPKEGCISGTVWVQNGVGRGFGQNQIFHLDVKLAVLRRWVYLGNSEGTEQSVKVFGRNHSGGLSTYKTPIYYS